MRLNLLKLLLRGGPLEWISELSSQNLSERAKGMISKIIMKKFTRGSTPVFLVKPYSEFSNLNIEVKKQTKENNT